MSSFTCITCRVAFADADIQRSHYKTDWHRYNLKRKVADLPPVTADNFQQRVLAQRAQVEEDNKDRSSYCQLCGKHFNTQNAYDNHLQSKKHKENVSKQELQLKTQIEEKNEEKGIEVLEQNEKVSVKNAKNQALKDSLPAGGDSVAMETEQAGTSQSGARPKVQNDKNQTENMEVEEEEVDSDEWEEWGGEPLSTTECLFCTRSSDNLDDNVKHMTTKHSFFIPDVEYLTDLEGLISYLGEKVGEGHLCLWCNEKGRMFPTIRAVQQHMVDKGHCKMIHDGDAVFEYTDFYDYRSSYPDFEEKALGEAAGGDGGEEEEEEEVPQQVLNDMDYQLVLPSGTSIGHRSLQRYYRQKLKPTRQITLHSVSRVIAQYKALGWTGSTGVDAQRRAKDMKYVQKIKSRHYLKLGIKANNQKHFRMQVQF